MGCGTTTRVGEFASEKYLELSPYTSVISPVRRRVEDGLER